MKNSGSEKLRNQKYKKIFWSKDVLYCLIFLLITQLILASSNVWYSKFASASTTGAYGSVIYYLVLSLGTIIFSTIPDTASNYFLNKSKINAINKYNDEIEKTFKNKPIYTFDPHMKREKEPWITSESEKTIDDSLTTIHRGLSMATGTVFSVGTLAYILDPTFFLGYSLSAISMPIIYFCLKKPLQYYTKASQVDRNQLKDTLLSSWQNITIGNKYNLTLWKNEFRARLDFRKLSSGKLIIWQGAANSLAMLGIVSPVIINTAWIMSSHSANPVILTTVIATLPQQVNMMFHIYSFFETVLLWKGSYSSRLEKMMDSIENTQSASCPEIVIDELQFLKDNREMLDFESIEQILKNISELNHGRITLQGNNGVGKSTLLSILKQRLGDQAFYLPANSLLFFNSSRTQAFSTGQKVKMHLNELFNDIIRTTRIKIILLDEWDANLDNSTIQEISNEISRIANEYLVLEVRHKTLTGNIQIQGSATEALLLSNQGKKAANSNKTDRKKKEQTAIELSKIIVDSNDKIDEMEQHCDKDVAPLIQRSPQSRTAFRGCRVS